MNSAQPPEEVAQKCQCGHTPAQHYLGILSCNVETCICFRYLEVGVRE